MNSLYKRQCLLQRNAQDLKKITSSVLDKPIQNLKILNPGYEDKLKETKKAELKVKHAIEEFLPEI